MTMVWLIGLRVNGYKNYILRGNIMIKLYCNRCGKEIKEEYYYTVNIYKTELHPKTSISALADAMSAYTEKSSYERLSSEKMYCKECKDDIEYFINNRESKEDAELRELSEWENLSE